MASNSFGHNFKFTSFGESHGKAIGCVVDGIPPLVPIDEKDIQRYLDRRKPGQSKFVTQRKESDTVEILSGTFEGKTTGHPMALIIKNEDQRSKDYSEISKQFRPGHADITYQNKYGIRDYRGGGRSSARETAVRVAAGAIAFKVLEYKLEKRPSLSGFSLYFLIESACSICVTWFVDVQPTKRVKLSIALIRNKFLIVILIFILS